VNGVPVEIASWLACLAFVVMLLNQGVKLYDRAQGNSRGTTIGPQPLMVREAEKFVTKETCMTHQNEVGEKLNRLEKAVAEARDKRDADQRDAAFSRKTIYGEIETLRKEMAAMERRLNQDNENRSVKIHDRINEILEAVSELRGQLKQ
jgi:hypothetical protein